jgi:hypothetical protein
MEYKLRIRLDLKVPQPKSFQAINYSLREDQLIDMIRFIGTESMQSKCRNFVATGKICDAYYLQSALPRSEYLKICDGNPIVRFIDIELNTNLRDSIIEPNAKNLLFQHGMILSGMRQIMAEQEADMEIVKVYDHRKKELLLLTDPTLSHPGISKYRMLLDGSIMIERFFPYGISEKEQLEESIYVDILPGDHTIEIENVGGHNQVFITDFAVDDSGINMMLLADRGLDDIKHSFQIQ